MIELAAAGAFGGDWHRRARDLMNVLVDRFSDADRGGFYFTDRTATELIVRQKTAADSPLPSGNAVAAMVDLASSSDGGEARKTLRSEERRVGKGVRLGGARCA